MTYLTILHWIFLVVLLAIVVGAIVVALRLLRGQVLVVSIIVTFISAFFIASIGFISLDDYTKKARVTNLENSRDLRNEMMVFTGDVTNVGDYTIGTVTLEIKLINKGSATSRASGKDFYQPNSFWDMISGSSGNKQQRPNTITVEEVIAVKLKPGERRRFKVPFKFPPYFTGVRFRTKVIAH